MFSFSSNIFFSNLCETKNFILFLDELYFSNIKFDLELKVITYEDIQLSFKISNKYLYSFSFSDRLVYIFNSNRLAILI